VQNQERGTFGGQAKTGWSKEKLFRKKFRQKTNFLEKSFVKKQVSQEQVSQKQVGQKEREREEDHEELEVLQLFDKGTPVKRGRGRPKKAVVGGLKQCPSSVKRGRGRPRNPPSVDQKEAALRRGICFRLNLFRCAQTVLKKVV
jgi:hypothetical protein